MALRGSTHIIVRVGGSIFAPACNALRPGGVGPIYAATTRIGLGGRREIFLGATPPGANPAQPMSRIASLNANSLRSAANKVARVAALPHEEDLDVLHKTLVRSTDRRPSFRGFVDFFAPGDRVTSERGCEVLIRAGLSARVVGRVTASWASVRVDVEVRGPAAIFTSNYLPTGRQGQPY